MVSVNDLLVIVGSMAFCAIFVVLIAKGTKKALGWDLFKELGIKTDASLKELLAIPAMLLIIIQVIAIANITISSAGSSFSCANMTGSNLTFCNNTKNVIQTNEAFLNPNNTAPSWYNESKAKIGNITFNMPLTQCDFLSGCATTPQIVSLAYICYEHIPIGITPTIMKSSFVDSYDLNYTSEIAKVNCTAYGDNTSPQNYSAQQDMYSD
jgi:hypothetical protein